MPHTSYNSTITADGARIVDHDDNSKKSNHVEYAPTAMALSAVTPGLRLKVHGLCNGKRVTTIKVRGKMVNYRIREIKPSETCLLKDFLYEAIFQRDEENLLPKDIINKPELRVFIEGFGKPDDYCLVADIDGKVVGAVWTRILSGEVKGYGNIDEDTPEFAISLYKEYRNMGIGIALMRKMLELLKERGYKRASLSVQKDNYAVRMYKKIGFKIVKESEEEYLMICDLSLP